MSELPNAIAFDVFGTLCHGHSSYGPYIKLRDTLNLPSESFREIAMTKDISLAEIVKHLRNDELTISEKDLVSRCMGEISEDCKNIVLFDDVIPTLTTLKNAGVPYGLISNLAQPYAKPVIELLEAHCLLPPNELCLWSFAEGVMKPDPIIFNRFCKRVNESPSHVLVVGDKERNDLQGPRLIGCQSRLLLRADDGRIISPDDYITSLMAIPRLLGLNVSTLSLDSNINHKLSP